VHLETLKMGHKLGCSAKEEEEGGGGGEGEGGGGV
jgi:hypothetical protein